MGFRSGFHSIKELPKEAKSQEKEECTGLRYDYLIANSTFFRYTLTAFVMAYEEVTGGASTAALNPSDVVGLITKYAEAENVDVSALTSAQVEGIVTKFAEATGCDKSELLREFTAYITEYKEAAGVKKPTLNMQVGLSGYDLLAYRRWLRNNKVEVEGVVRLSEVYEDPSGVLGESGVKYWKDGEEIPVTAVTSDMLRPEDVAIL
ncbi:MAG: hypothetical protein IJ719_07325, partial [Clostridia bacterium]|nr:hypothetical protein [Clostridia bacterium]